MNTIREEFEAWLNSEGWSDDGFMWQAWQAARQPVGDVWCGACWHHGIDHSGGCIRDKRNEPDAAPLAQQPKRVDFSAFRELAESWKVMVEPDPDKQAWAMHHANCCCADELIALTYQQESKP